MSMNYTGLNRIDKSIHQVNLMKSKYGFTQPIIALQKRGKFSVHRRITLTSERIRGQS